MISDEKARYLEGDRTQYKCGPGYVLEGTEWIICRGQKWTPAPRCMAPCGITKQQLDAKDLLLPGKRRRSQVIQHNHTLQFLCKEGHVITVPSVRKCIDGHMDLPSCISGKHAVHIEKSLYGYLNVQMVYNYLTFQFKSECFQLCLSHMFRETI
ncbi:complement factor H-related protein 3-like [Zootoca vivipara]|uniref:complement factor H-related protein 3-like n=1 Tax=Zootoca vivipara TaxID=8524 RepID=UPI00293BE06A|nr:complement factor H-related protein 3-like [Zootoca vivipara]